MGYSTVLHWMNQTGRYSRPAARYSARVPLLCPTDLWQTFRWRGAEHNAGVEAARMDLIALEGRVATARVEVRGGGGAAAELELAGCLYELACGYLATGQDGSVRNRQAAAMEPAQEAATIRLKWLTSGYVSAEFAGKLQDTLRVVEQAARAAGHRDLAIEPLRNACAAYAQVARNHPEAAGVCADGLSKCGVWLCRSEPYEAVKAADEATKIRAALFIADPGQSRKYLATLNMLLRTLMVGRGRKQAVAMYRQRYAALTSANMTAQLRTMKIEEVGFTNKTYTALAKLDCATLERAGRLTQQHILYQSGGDLATIEEINWHLALVGLKPLAPGAIPDPPAKPVEIGSSFGALTVHCTTAGAVRRVREAVIAAYAADGAELVSVSQFTGIPKERWTNPEMNTAERLGTDLVLLEQLSGSWVAVQSLEWEVTPVARNPLALRLAKHWPVVSVTTVEELSYELCWYEKGEPTHYAALGRPADPTGLSVPLAPLDFGKLADYGSDYASETQVRAAFGNTAMFTKLTQLPAHGIRQALEAHPLSSYGDQILCFQRT